MNEEVRVTYTVKDLLGRIDHQLESISGKLDAKANVRDVLELRDRVGALERVQADAVAVQANLKSTFTKREKMAALFLTLVALLLQLLPHLGGGTW